MSLQNIIETAFEQRAEITPHNVSAEVKEAVLDTIYQLDSGSLRVAERQGVGQWKVNEWAKKAVLLSFRIADNEVSSDGVSKYFDKEFTDVAEESFKHRGIVIATGEKVVIGSRQLLKDENVVVTDEQKQLIAEKQEPYNLLFLGYKGQLISIFCVDIPLRDEANKVLTELRNNGKKVAIFAAIFPLKYVA